MQSSLDQGAVIAWFAVDGYFGDPTEDLMASLPRGAWAGMSPSLGFACRSTPDGFYDPLNYEELSLLAKDAGLPAPSEERNGPIESRDYRSKG